MPVDAKLRSELRGLEFTCNLQSKDLLGSKLRVISQDAYPTPQKATTLEDPKPHVYVTPNPTTFDKDPARYLGGSQLRNCGCAVE